MTMNELEEAKRLVEKIELAEEYKKALLGRIASLSIPAGINNTSGLQYLTLTENSSEYEVDLVMLREDLNKSVTIILDEHAKKYRAAFADL